MKKLVVVVVLLVLILGVAPWGVGRIAEGRVNKNLDKLVEVAPYLNVVERKWTGGWFRSEQEVTFEFFGAWLNGVVPGSSSTTSNTSPSDAVVAMKVADEPAQEPMPEPAAEGEMSPGASTEEGTAPAKPLFPASMRVTVKNEIFHGPVLWTSGIGLAEIRSKIVLSDDIRQKIIEVFGTDEPVRLKTRVGLFGGGTSTFHGEGRSIKGKGADGTFSYEDFKLAISYSGDMDSFDIEGRQPRVEFAGKTGGEHMLIRGTQISGSSERIVGDLYDTDFQLEIAEINGTGPDKKSFGVEDVHYLFDTDKNGDFIDIRAKVGSGELKSPDLDQLGVKLKEVHYDFSLHRLHIETLARMSTKVKEIYSKPLPVATAEAAQNAFLAPLKEDGIALFKHDPEIGIDRLGIVTAEGEGVIKGLIKFKGVTAEDFANPMAIVPKLDVELNVEVPTRMIEKFPNGSTISGAAVDSGYMKRDGDKLVCKLTFKSGELLVNGKPQAIPGLGGPPPGGAVGPEMPREGMNGMEGMEGMPEAPPPQE